MRAAKTMVARLDRLQREYLKDLESELSLSGFDARRLIRDFQREMLKGLEGRKGSLRMIPTFVDRPKGSEKGTFLALDLGGTNFRVLSIKLHGRGRSGRPAAEKYSIPDCVIRGSGEELFGFLADCIRRFVDREKIPGTSCLPLGFTFSFPVRQTGIASGVLLHWTKGFSARGVIGRDVVSLLTAALKRRGLGGISVAALANDTVGTLMACAYSDPDCDVGVILGTGTNACYCEKISKIRKWKGARRPSASMVVNIEWGNFDRIRLTSFDRALDSASSNPGRQLLEKQVSGMYLGEIGRRIVLDAIRKGVLFGKGRSRVFEATGALRTEDLSAFAADRSASLKVIGRFLAARRIPRSTREDRLIMKEIGGLVAVRAARVTAAALTAVILKADVRRSRRHTVAIDGTVYERYCGFSALVAVSLREFLGAGARRIRLVHAKDGSGIGAAVIAAVAAENG